MASYSREKLRDKNKICNLLPLNPGVLGLLSGDVLWSGDLLLCFLWLSGQGCVGDDAGPGLDRRPLLPRIGLLCLSVNGSVARIGCGPALGEAFLRCLWGGCAAIIATKLRPLMTQSPFYNFPKFQLFPTIYSADIGPQFGTFSSTLFSQKISNRLSKLCSLVHEY